MCDPNVGFVLGPIRVFWLEPVVKTFIAANFGLLPLIIFWALMVPGRLHPRQDRVLVRFLNDDQQSVEDASKP